MTVRREARRQSGVRARRRFGQHFLEPAWIEKVIAAIDPRPEDRFLEIGPGRGALTLPLAHQARDVIAVEVDRDLAATLARSAPPNVHVIARDFLELDVRAVLAESDQGPVRVAGNLPYNISSPILFRLLDVSDQGRLLLDATLMLQREVAERLLASPGTKEYGVLGILVQLRADVTPVLTLPPGAFRPMPKVASTLVRLTFRPPAVHLVHSALFDRIVRTTFTRRRKTLLNALKPFASEAGRAVESVVEAAGLDPQRRPETLHLAEFARLAEVFAAGGG